MANIKRAELRADSGQVNPSEEAGASHPPTQQQQTSGSLSEVSANVSDLMAPEKESFGGFCERFGFDRS